MLKRIFDVTTSAVALLLAAPLMIFIALSVRKRLGSPALFRQQRPGRDGRPFTLLKFRSMREAVDGRGVPLADGERLTPFGNFLRSSSLDELPELWNVLRGDMSLVGPRPLLMAYLPLFSAEQSRRHSVRPGITGWAQVNGRNSLSWEEKFALDVWYVDHQSFWLDLKIIASTIRKVLARDGISAAGHVTMPPFEGSHETRK